MKYNKLRVVCNPVAKHISYYYKNEANEWHIFSSSSPLSRSYYTDTRIEERADEIVVKLDEIYNRKNKGIDISFEGDEESYIALKSAIERNLPKRNIQCHIGSTKVIVTGKVGVGKTTLIEEIERLNDTNFTVEEFENYILYRDANNTEWYEIKGIDFGRGNVERAYSNICKVVENTSAMIVYCIHSSNRRIEEVESQFIMNLIASFPELAGMVVLTHTVNKKGLGTFVDEIEKMTQQIKVIPVLAKEFTLDMEDKSTKEPIVLMPFGLDKLAEYIFEGR